MSLVDRVPTKRELWTFRKRYLPFQRLIPYLGLVGIVICIAAFFTNGTVKIAIAILIAMFGLVFGAHTYLKRKHRLLYTNYFMSRGISFKRADKHWQLETYGPYLMNMKPEAK